MYGTRQNNHFIDYQYFYGSFNTVIFTFLHEWRLKSCDLNHE